MIYLKIYLKSILKVVNSLPIISRIFCYISTAIIFLITVFILIPFFTLKFYNIYSKFRNNTEILLNVNQKGDLFEFVTEHHIKVPINWDDKNNLRKISISYLELSNKYPQRLYIFIPGGPFGTARSMEGNAYNIFKKDPHSKVIMFDHRGTGDSTNLDFECGIKFKKLDYENYLKQCSPILKKKFGSDLSSFNSYQAAKDLDYIISLYPDLPTTVYGVSYGTSVALRLATIGEKRVDSYILDSATQPYLNFGKNKNNSINSFLTYCSNDNSCKKHVPYKNEKELNDFLKEKAIECSFNNEQQDDINDYLKRFLKYDSSKDDFYKSIEYLGKCDFNKTKEMYLNIVKDDFLQSRIEELVLGSESKFMFLQIKCIEFNEKNNVCKYFNDENKDGLSYKKEDLMNSKNQKFLVLTGDDDTITPLEEQSDIYKTLPEKKEMIIFKDRHHAPLTSDRVCLSNIIYSFSKNQKNLDLKQLNDCKYINYYSLNNT